MSKSPLSKLIAEQRRRQAGPLIMAAVAAAVVGAGSTALLGLSGWFITGAALAGVAGLAAAQAFNVLLPSATIRLLAILRTVARYGERLQGHAAALDALAAIRPRLFAALASAPPREALAISRGEAAARLVQDVDAVETRFVRLSAPWGAGAGVAMAVALAALGGIGPAIAILVAVFIHLVLARALTRRLSAPAGAAIQAAAGELKEALAAFAAAAPELKVYGAEGPALDRIAALGDRLDALKVRAARAQGILALSEGTLTGLAVAAVLALAAPASAPLAALAALAAVMAIEAAAPIARAFEQDGAAEAAGERLDALLRHAPEEAPPARPGRPALRLQGQDLPPGARLALTGPTGSGKTTRLEQLVGLRPAPAEAFALGGQDSANLPPAALRPAFAYAPQDAALLADTVRDNLKLAAPAASEEALWAALDDAALADRVRALPQGLDTWLGEAGERLSGGERRRLSLARALLRDAPWLLLDEPTEGLDPATEAQVIARLDERLRRTGQGLVLVSHRPAPLALCGRTMAVETVSRPAASAISRPMIEPAKP
ncbi:amino acid ABC transporter ATP-binding/permease protein [Caulobacter endophyticus]|uniref:amino acid ABC transporter ATP-binding/permease protein n=1 Tax=Caulobacter endophyticus TaxID=2172652 RepID=UPI00240EB03F|nr:ATP-binding cassette domain-containing protein [Caulobacter endophyticus]MDG2527766.1 ATP-binding cassette domain-containing protein [Caulobacter endophyticus]